MKKNLLNPLDKVFDASALIILENKLMNRFLILTFLEKNGADWAAVAIDPENPNHWNHDSYLACYNNPQG